jgi:hypothetical protein
MSPIHRRAFLGALAAIPAAAFLPLPRAKRYEVHLWNPSTGQRRVTPIIIGDVPREWLTLPYYRSVDADVANQFAYGLPTLTLITAYDQDHELS